jgi:SWI/SNF-related matrix-associated actin-dependent regulator of chromatin subfamily A-like protein 1
MFFDKNPAVGEILNRIHEIRKSTKSKEALQHWTAPLTLDAIQKLHQACFAFDENVTIWEQMLFSNVKINPQFTVPGLLHTLLPYQIEGVQMIEHWNGRVLLADDQGLGKTVQALGWLQLHPELRPVLIVCPANLKMNWKTECEFWLQSPKVQIISGTALQDIWGDYVIINYDILSQQKDNKDVIRSDIFDTQWEAMLWDEAHYINESETIRGWACLQLHDKEKPLIAITATPGKNRPKDYFTIINAINDKIFPSFFKYVHRYCDAKKGYKGHWDYSGASHEIELHNLLKSTMMIRRKKSDVFKDLPAKIRRVVTFELDNQTEYTQAEENFQEWLIKNGKDPSDSIFSQIEALKQLAVKGKIKAVIQWVKSMLETTDKMVIFAEHKETINALMSEFGKIAVRCDGGTSDVDRERAKQKFQECHRCKVRKEKHNFDPLACDEYVPSLSTRLYIASKAGKEGNTLTAAEHVVFTELWWSPSDMCQGEDRCYGRAGDLHGATAWYLIAHNTIEEHISHILDLKNVTLSQIMDGKEPDQKHLLMKLLKEVHHAKNNCSRN